MDSRTGDREEETDSKPQHLTLYYQDKCLTHRGLTENLAVDPDWEPEQLVYKEACSVTQQHLSPGADESSSPIRHHESLHPVCVPAGVPVWRRPCPEAKAMQ